MPDIRIRPLAGADLPMLAAWLREPHLTADGSDPDEEMALIRADLAAPDPRYRMWLAELSGAPFAYLQDCDCARGPQPFHAAEPPGTRSMGVFVGPPAMLGRKLAAPTIRAFADHLAALGARRVVADVEPWNRPSLAAFARAGFAEAGMAADADGDPARLFALDLTLLPSPAPRSRTASTAEAR